MSFTKLVLAIVVALVLAPFVCVASTCTCAGVAVGLGKAAEDEQKEQRPEPSTPPPRTSPRQAYGYCKASAGETGICVDQADCHGLTETGRCPGTANVLCCFDEPGVTY